MTNDREGPLQALAERIDRAAQRIAAAVDARDASHAHIRIEARAAADALDELIRAARGQQHG